MTARVRFSYTDTVPTFGTVSLRPMLPLTLASTRRSITVEGLVDSGSSLCVLPLGLGLKLGWDWDKQNFPLTLAGNLSTTPAHAAVLMATVATFPPVQIAFAWARTDDVPVILGQTNFFTEFEICFFRAQAAFEVKPK